MNTQRIDAIKHHKINPVDILHLNNIGAALVQVVDDFEKETAHLLSGMKEYNEMIKARDDFAKHVINAWDKKQILTLNYVFCQAVTKFQDALHLKKKKKRLFTMYEYNRLLESKFRVLLDIEEKSGIFNAKK
jgi:hypothetical protein